MAPTAQGFNPPGITCQRAELRGQFTQLPLGFMVEFDEAGIVVEAEYLVEVLDAALARQLLEHYAVLLDSALADPDLAISELDLMGPADTDWLRRVSAGEEFITPAHDIGRPGGRRRSPAHRTRSPWSTRVATTPTARSTNRRTGSRTG